VNYHRGVDSYVVVAKDGVAQGSGEAGDDLGTAMGCVSSGDEGDGTVGNEVSREEDEIGREGVYFVNDMFEEVGLGVLVEVDVADLDDAVAIEGWGQIPDGDGAVDDVELVSGDFTGVESKCCSGGASSYDEVASAKARRLVGFKAGHRS
jgi:hypothetical protein